MKKFLLTGCAAALMASFALPAGAAPLAKSRFLNPEPLHYAPKADGPRFATVTPEAASMALRPFRAPVPEQTATSDNFGYLDSPKGEIWFYTLDLVTTEVKHEAYTESFVSGFKVTVFDGSFNEIGKIEDTVELQEGDTKVAQIGVGAQVTQKFFNYDTSYEIMIDISCNTKEFVNRDYTLVYSLGKEEPIMTIPGYYVSAINTATDSFSEKFWITFITEEDTETPAVGDNVNTMDYVLKTYKSAGYSGMGDPVLVTRVPGITRAGENDAIFLAAQCDGQPWFAVAHLKYCFYEDMFDYENNNPTADNSLIVDLYTTESKFSSNITHYSQSAIPTGATADNLTFKYLGGFSYNDDLSFGRYTLDGSPSLIVTTANTVNADSYTYDFDVYTPAAKGTETEGAAEKKLNLATGISMCVFLADVPGSAPQMMTVKEGDTDLSFDFVNLLNGETENSIPSSLGGNYNMTTSVERVPVAGGGYLYAVAQLRGGSNDNGEMVTAVVYLKPDGSIDHTDLLNLGEYVDYAQIYIGSNALDPFLFNLDTNREYMTLVKRKDSPDSDSNHEELVVIPAGNDFRPLLQLGPDDELGRLTNIALVNLESDNPLLNVIYCNNDWKYTCRSYTVPLELFAEGDGSIENPYKITTAGGLRQLATHPSAHFVIANDIDATGFTLEANSAFNFTGSLDGGNHLISNLTVKGRSIFPTLTGDEVAAPEDGDPDDVDNDTEKTRGVVQNIRFVNPVFEATADEQGLVAGNAQFATIRNIHVYGGKYSSEADIEGIVGQASLYTVIEECSVNAVITSAEGAVGGIVGNTRTSASVSACAFSGTITSGGSNVGGIAGSVNGNAGAVSNCHVNADIKGASTVGGIVGSSDRAVVCNNHIEGTIEATVGSRWGGGPKAGGVIGELAPDYMSMADESAQVKPVVYGNYVNVASITFSGEKGEEEFAGQNDTMHRIVGMTIVNNEPEPIGYDENNDWAPIYGDPYTADKGLANNYASPTLAIVNATIADDAASTEGKTLGEDEAGMDFFMETLSWGYGYSADEPWSYTGNPSAPSLYFESKLLLATPAEVEVGVDETASIVLSVAGGEISDEDVEGFSFDCTDESVVEMTDMAMENGTIVITVKGLKAGTARINFSLGNSTASVTVTVSEKSAIDNISGDNAAEITVSGREIVSEGNMIEVYNVSGILVASGRDNVSLDAVAQGVYVVRAGSAVKKIAIR